LTAVVDASVWVASQHADERRYEESRECLVKLLASSEAIALPWLALVECVAAVSRRSGNEGLGREAGRLLLAIPGLHWVPLDASGAARAAEVARVYRLRAADAVYVSVAREHRASLITLDHDVGTRVLGEVPVVTPAEWMEQSDT
jgi:predicted nucleic acid-binding protein